MGKSNSTTANLTYAQRYYIKIKAERLGMTFDEYVNSDHYQKGGSKRKASATVGSSPRALITERNIAFDRVCSLDKLAVNDDMLRVNKTGLALDAMFSHDGGIPVGTNVMCTGDPGVGKTTLLMHAMSHLQHENKSLKCVFISAEMSKIQVYKYMKRFPAFANLETMFTSDFLDYNMKDVIEQLLQSGYDYVLMDSIVEVLDSVKEDNRWSQGQAEKWLIDLCVKHNEANNKANKYTTFLLIQQVTKAGVFVGSNKMKHITDAHLEMKRESERDGGGTYLYFAKNRNGRAGVKYPFMLSSSEIYYDPTAIFGNSESEERTFQLENQTR